MKLVFVTRKFPPSVGGMERFAYDLYHALDKRAVVSLAKWGGSNIWLPVVIPYLFVRALFVTWFGRPDVIHIQDGVLAPVGYVLSVLTRKPWTIIIHGLDTTYENIIYRNVNLRCLRRADRIFCISQTAADETMKRGVSADKIQIIPLGITDHQHFDRAEAQDFVEKELSIQLKDHLLLLTSGRLVKRKGVAWFVEHVMPDLIKKAPHALYLVVGEGEDRQQIIKLISEKHLEQHVRLLGQAPDQVRDALYRSADVFVMPNIPVPEDAEGFGRVALEAAVCELPVVASGIEGIRDAIKDQQNGVLVPSRDAAAFEREILKFTNDTHARSFGKKSRDYTLKHYDWDTIANQYIDGYKHVIR